MTSDKTSLPVIWPYLLAAKISLGRVPVSPLILGKTAAFLNDGTHSHSLGQMRELECSLGWAPLTMSNWGLSK